MTPSVRSFDVVVVPFPFSDTPGVVKPRPALVLSSDAHRRTGQVIVAMITSADSNWSGDVDIENWLDVGLPKPSKVRTAKLATFDRDAIQRRLGSLNQEGRVMVKTYLREFLDY